MILVITLWESLLRNRGMVAHLFDICNPRYISSDMACPNGAVIVTYVMLPSISALLCEDENCLLTQNIRFYRQYSYVVKIGSFTTFGHSLLVVVVPPLSCNFY